tara:strand:- start:1515 stop:2489 length:975 start_codon:yes stop_codon:yes gene_type:complete
MYVNKLAQVGLFLASQALFAGTTSSSCNDKDGAPCKQSSWGFGAAALYLQPATDSVQNMPLNLTSLTGSTLNSGNKLPWSWGFKLDGVYKYNETNDLSLSWYRLKISSSSHSVSTTPNSFNLLILGTASLESLDWQSTGEQSWNAANFEIGRRINFDTQDTIRIYAGGQYARIKSSLAVTGNGVVSASTILVDIPPTDISVSGSNVASYNGFGPRMGIDLSHTWGKYPVSIYGKGAMEILAGSNHGRIATPEEGMISGTAITVVPGFEAKLGASSDYAYAHGRVMIDAGWMWVTYLNLGGINKYDTNSFSVEGLYFGLKWLSES